MNDGMHAHVYICVYGAFSFLHLWLLSSWCKEIIEMTPIRTVTLPIWDDEHNIPCKANIKQKEENAVANVKECGERVVELQEEIKKTLQHVGKDSANVLAGVISCY